MSQAPTPYTRQNNFVSDAQNNPNITVPQVATDLEAEYNAIATSVNQAIGRLNEIQRDDGALRRIVNMDSLSPDTLTLLSIDTANIKGTWATATAYAKGDVVTLTGGTYICAVAHTSGASLGNDAVAGKWLTLQSPPANNATVVNRFTSNGVQTVFSLTDTSTTNATNVFINGVYQQKNTYTVSGNQLTLSDAAPNGAIIEAVSGTLADTLTVADLSITANKLGPEAVEASKIQDAAVTVSKLATASVSEPKIVDGAVTAAKITAGAVISSKIADSAVTTAKLADLEVTVAKLANALDLSSKTVTLPNASIVQSKFAPNVAGNGPAFRANNAANQAIATATWTKVNLATEHFDTANCFSNSRFTPRVAGYYLISGTVAFTAQLTAAYVGITKNGSGINGLIISAGGAAALTQSVSDIVFLNGTTDFVEMSAYQAQGTTQNISTSSVMSGVLIRAA